MTASVDERVGRGVGEKAGCGVGLGSRGGYWLALQGPARSCSLPPGLVVGVFLLVLHLWGSTRRLRLVGLSDWARTEAFVFIGVSEVAVGVWF